MRRTADKRRRVDPHRWFAVFKLALLALYALTSVSALAQDQASAAACLLKAAGLRLTGEEKTRFLNDCRANPDPVGKQNPPPEQTPSTEGIPVVKLPRPKPLPASSARPNQEDALKCARKFFDRWVTTAPSSLRCDEFVKLNRVRIGSKKADGNAVDLLVELDLITSKTIPATGGVANSCTGAEWGQAIPANKRIVLKKVLSFTVSSGGAVCETTLLEPIVDGDAWR